MKKKSRFLTGLLSAVMALSLFALPASAEGLTKVPTTPDFSGTTKGSITINKYAYKSDTDDPRDNGENNPAIPDGASALDGVQFTIYKVEDNEWLKGYYDGTNKTAEPNIDTYVESNEIKSGYANVPHFEGTTGTAGTDGQVVFSDLEVGLYVVIETDQPDSVTSVTEPFFVSIPMTSPVDKNTWLYDVTVNPKNNTEYAGITLEKKGKTGNAVDATKMAGYTFTLDKYVDGEWTPITKETSNGVINAGEKLNLTTGSEGTISVEDLSNGVYRFTEASTTDKSGYIVDSHTHYLFKVNGKKIEKIPENERNTYAAETGYVNNFDSVNSASTAITVYNDRPDIEKKVTDRKTGKFVNESDYSVGDEIPYTVTVTIPENITALKKFIVTDSSKNLEYVDGSITSIAVKDKKTVVDIGAYTVVNGNTADHGFTIEFKTAEMGTYAGETLIINYKSKLLSSAVTTVDGNPNTVKLVYSNQVLPETDPSNPSNPSDNWIQDDAVVYTFKIKVLKTAEDRRTRLTGVKFDLYKNVKTADLTNAQKTNALEPAEATKLGLVNTNDYSWVKINATALETNRDGMISVPGLANGDYYLVETETAPSYNLLSGPVKVTLQIESATTHFEKNSYDPNGNLTKHKASSKTTTFKNDDDDEVGAFTTQVINRKGLQLPVTGGFGTLLFSGIGALLVVGGVGVLMSTKKKKGNT